MKKLIKKLRLITVNIKKRRLIGRNKIIKGGYSMGLNGYLGKLLEQRVELENQDINSIVEEDVKAYREKLLTEAKEKQQTELKLLNAKIEAVQELADILEQEKLEAQNQAVEETATVPVVDVTAEPITISESPETLENL